MYYFVTFYITSIHKTNRRVNCWIIGISRPTAAVEISHFFRFRNLQKYRKPFRPAAGVSTPTGSVPVSDFFRASLFRNIGERLRILHASDAGHLLAGAKWKKPHKRAFFIWLRRQDSNLRPMRYTESNTFVKAWTISLPFPSQVMRVGTLVSSLYGALNFRRVPSVLA